LQSTESWSAVTAMVAQVSARRCLAASIT
jgi:hypothetical protein